jgi:hypothetical protein
MVRWNSTRCDKMVRTFWGIRSTLSRVMPYERFEAFQACDELVICVYRVTKSYPVGEFRRHLDISIGSLAEVSYLLRVA